MSCPSGEGRSQGEGAASFSLGFNNPPRCRTAVRRSDLRSAHVSLPAASTFLRAPAYFLTTLSPERSMPRCRVTRRVHFNAAHRLHNPDATEAWNQATYRGVQQPELSRAQLRAGPVGRGGDQPADGLRDGPEPPQGPGPGATAPPPGPQEPQPRRPLVPGAVPTSENIAAGLLAGAPGRASRRLTCASACGRRRGTMSTTKATDGTGPGGPRPGALRGRRAPPGAVRRQDPRDARRDGRGPRARRADQDPGAGRVVAAVPHPGLPHDGGGCRSATRCSRSRTRA